MDSGPTAEIMAKIACFGVASWLQSGTTDVATLTAASSGRGGGRSDWCLYSAEGSTDGSPLQEAKILQCHFTHVNKFLFDCHYILHHVTL